MAFDLIPQTFWKMPTLVEEDDDNWSLSPLGNSGSSISVSEDDKNVYISASVPGLEESDIDVTFDKGILWIKGETKSEEKNSGRKYYRRASTSFSYRIAVPGDIDTAKEPDATYKNGVMSVTFAKSPKSQPKKISVKSGK